MTQDEIKKKIQEARNQGVPDEVTFKYLNDKGLIPKDKIVQQTSTPQVVQESPNNPTFNYTGLESPLQAGLKSAGNVPSSVYNLGKGLVSAVANPIDTLSGIGKMTLGGIQSGVKKVTGVDIGNQETKQSFSGLTDALYNRYGSLDNLSRTAVEDPAGFGADVLSLVSGGASLVGKGAELSNIISKTGRLATTPVAKATNLIKQGVNSTAKFATAQATGLNPETITQLVTNPQAFKGVTSEARIAMADTVKSSLDSRLQELSGLGKEYQVLRDSNQVVTIPPDTIKNVLNKYGVKLDANNNILTSTESRPLSLGDKNAIQEFINNYGNERVLSSNGFLNTREALSNLAKYDATKTNISTSISRDLRSAYDALGKKQINGLEALDSQFAPERQLLGQLKKDIFTPQGELKDGAISKIANITGKGKEKLLLRMKEIVPDIEQRVKIIKAVEDIERAGGQKVGTYLKAGGTLLGITTGNLPVIVGSILAQPEIAQYLLKGAGYVGQKATPILNAVKTIANDINNFKMPAQFIDSDTGGLKMGLSTKDITKTIPLSVKGTMRDFTDYVNGAYKPTGQTLKNLLNDAQDIANKYSFTSATKGNKSLAKQFAEYLDSVNFDRKIKK